MTLEGDSRAPLCLCLCLETVSADGHWKSGALCYLAFMGHAHPKALATTWWAWPLSSLSTQQGVGEGRDVGNGVSTGKAAVLGRGGRPLQHGVSDQLWISKLDVKHAQK